ncbi:MAG: 50S ribosomal protein L4 [Christensenellaceae bacterium]
MPSMKLYNMKAEEVGTIELQDALFNAEFKESLIHQAVVSHLANMRQGTKSTLTRTEVRGGGRKPYRQKGTGNARQGSTRAPQWIKGGVVFAPKSRDFSKKMNVVSRRSAMFSALSKKIGDGEVFVIDEIKVANGKTKEMVEFVNAFKFEKTVLIVMCDNDELVIRACSNLQKVSTLPVQQLNTYDVVKNSVVVMAKGSIEKLQEVYGE